MCKCTKSTENAARHFPHAYAPAIDGRVPADLAGVTFGDCFVNCTAASGEERSVADYMVAYNLCALFPFEPPALSFSPCD